MSDEVLAPLLTVGLLCGLALFYPLLQLIASVPAKRRPGNDPLLSSEFERQTAVSAYTTI